MKILIILSALLLSSPLACFSGDEVNNAAGLAEANITYAYLNISGYADICLSTSSCSLSERERVILKKIKRSMPDEYSSKDQLEFLSERDNPGTFIIDGVVKIAKTGDDVGSPIQINQDLIYYKNRLGIDTAINLQRAIALLIHELGHHHDEDNHLLLDLLGIKVSMTASTAIHESSFFSHSDNIKIVVFNPKTKKSFPQILLYIHDEIIDASKVFKSALKCNFLAFPSVIDILPDFAISFKKPKSAIFHNIHWPRSTKLERLVRCPPDFDKESLEECRNSKHVHIQNFYIKGNLTNLCEESSTLFNGNKNYKASIKFRTYVFLDKNQHLKFKYYKKSIKVRQLWEPWWKILNFNLTRY